MMLFHYTHYCHAVSICADGLIKVEKKINQGVHGGSAVVWFSTEPRWEPTASKAVIDAVTGLPRTGNMRDTFEQFGGLVRFEIAPNAAFMNWKEYRAFSGISAKHANELEADGKALGADPINWFCSFEPVTRDNWLCIEEIIEPDDPDRFPWKKSTRLS
jgi:hypothetical protein